MDEFKKNLIKTSATLMIIAGGAAVLVGATNALTAPVIAKNEAEKERQQLSQVFGDKANAFVEWKSYDSEEDQKDKAEEHEGGTYLSEISKKLNYVQKIWTARKTSGDPDKATDSDKAVGYVARIYGKNGYGAVDLLVGINLNGTYSKIAIITDSMSYKSKLESDYLDPYNNASDKNKETALGNVKCGATFAATLVKNGVEEAKKACLKEIVAGVDEEAMIFGGSRSDYTELTIPADAKYVKSVFGCAQGYVFNSYADVKGDFGSSSMNIYIAVNKDGTLHSIVLPSAGAGNTYGNPQTYVDHVNKADNKEAALDDEVKTSSTYSNSAIRDMVKEALDLVKQKKVASLSYLPGFDTDVHSMSYDMTYSFEERR